MGRVGCGHVCYCRSVHLLVAVDQDVHVKNHGIGLLRTAAHIVGHFVGVLMEIRHCAAVRACRLQAVLPPAFGADAELLHVFLRSWAHSIDAGDGGGYLFLP